jgi:hypothetical protein
MISGRHRAPSWDSWQAQVPNPETSRVPPCLASRLLCGVEDVQPLLHLEDHEAGHLQLVWVAALTGRADLNDDPLRASMPILPSTGEES